MQVSSAVDILSDLPVPEFKERIDSGAYTGWVRLHKKTDLLNGSYPFMQNDWLCMRIEIKPVRDRDLQASLGPILSQIPPRCIRLNESHIAIHNEGTQVLKKLHSNRPF